jgi:hypothetical protein
VQRVAVQSLQLGQVQLDLLPQRLLVPLH